jgi:acetate kinase
VRVLVVNAGSSSVKLRVVGSSDEIEAARDLGPPDGVLGGHLHSFLEEVGQVDATGHRIVHGGSRFVEPLMVDDSSEEALSHLQELAPLHNPPALAALDAVRKATPNVQAVACFDTAFHATLPPEASAYALPLEWVRRWGLRRYGFHGLSCEWATERCGEMLGPGGRLVICHLGSGASVTAVRDGHSTDTTMGFTPMEGLVMATRPGDVDPGLIAWLAEDRLAPQELNDALERRSGLLGLSSYTGDMRTLLERRQAGDPEAGHAVSVYLHRLRAKIAAMAAAMDGLDALVFTGGVGENSATIRAETCERLGWLGVAIDNDANQRIAGEDADISGSGTAVRTLAIHAREELVISRICRSLLGSR